MFKFLYPAIVMFMINVLYVSAVEGQQTSLSHAECYDNSIQVSCPFPRDYFPGIDFSGRAPDDYSFTRLAHGGVELEDDALHADYGGPWIMTRDNSTGLVWEVKTADNKYDKYSYDQAVFWAERIDLGGYSDWRIPSAGELFSLVDKSRHAPAIDEKWFPNTLPENYWSSSADPFDYGGIWRIRFGSGIVLFTYNRSAAYYVRAVRFDDR